jgi:hypothetical protein
VVEFVHLLRLQFGTGIFECNTPSPFLLFVPIFCYARDAKDLERTFDVVIMYRRIKSEWLAGDDVGIQRKKQLQIGQWLLSPHVVPVGFNVSTTIKHAVARLFGRVDEIVTLSSIFWERRKRHSLGLWKRQSTTSPSDMPPKQASFTISSALSTVANHLKPHKAEAIQRIRYNALCLFTTLVISYLLPLPSLPSALRTAFKSSHHAAWSNEWFWERMCLLGQ